MSFEAAPPGLLARLWQFRRRGASLLLTVTLLFGMAAACLFAADIGGAVRRALPALPGAILIHGVQLGLAALAWRGLFHLPRPGFGMMVRARWIRESLNSLLPLVGIGGGVLAARAIARQTGLPFAGVAAGATVDLMIESVVQLPFLLVGFAAFSLVAPGMLPLSQAAALLLPLVLAAIFALLVARGVGRAPAQRLARRLGLEPGFLSLMNSLALVHAGLGPVARGAALHFLAWLLGGVEVWLILGMLGSTPGIAAALSIEALGMAARSLGFALPAGLGAQEAGLAVVATMLGVPMEAGVAMAMLKRLREVVMAVPGVIAWQMEERQALRRAEQVRA